MQKKNPVLITIIVLKMILSEHSLYIYIVS